MGIWGDLVKRSKPTTTPKVEPIVVPPDTAPVAAPTIPAARASSAPRRASAKAATTDAMPPPFHQEPDGPATVVVTSALSRPLVLSPLAEVPKSSELNKENPKPTPVKKMVVAEPEEEAKPDINASLPLLLARLKEPPGSTERSTPLAYTPEQAITFLSGLPQHLSQESRFARMAEELAQVGLEDQTLAADIVGEAAAKLVALRRELSTRQTVHNSQLKAEKKHIEQLEADLVRLRAELALKENAFQEERQETLTQVDEMTGVIVFFDSYQSYRLQNQEGAPIDEDQLPAFLQDDTAETLLGIQKKKR